MPNPLSLKSLSNPAWLRAAINNRAMRSPEDLEAMRALGQRVDRVNVDPETAFLLRRQVEMLPERSVSPLEAIQMKLPGFAGGGSILNRALRYVKRAPHSDIPLDNGEVSALYINPSESELARLMNTSRRVADIEGGQAAVRFLRDLRNQDIYAADGNKVLHSDMTGHLGLDPDKTAKDIWFIDEPQERALNFLRSKPVEKCRGGLVSLRRVA